MQAQQVSPHRQRLARYTEKPQLMNINEVYQKQQKGHECGYCKKKDGSVTWSFTKKNMQTYTYELLMEKGWRRCGTYYYKPDLAKSCCKSFTHRLDVTGYRPKKDQKKALKKLIALAYDRPQSIKQQKINTSQQTKKQQKTKPKSNVGQLSEQILSQLSLVCSKITQNLKENIRLFVKGLNQQQWPNFFFGIDLKLKFFQSKPGEKANYYSNYGMLLFGMNRNLFQNKNYNLIQFCKELRPAISQIGCVEGYQIELQRGGYLLFTDTRIKKEPQSKVQVNSSAMKQEKQQKIQGQQTSQKLNRVIQSQAKNQVKVQQKPTQNTQMQNQDVHQCQLLITSKCIKFGKLRIDIIPAQKSRESFQMYSKYSQTIHEKPQKAFNSYVNFLCLQALQFRTQTKIIQDRVYSPAWSNQKNSQKSIINGQIEKPLGCFHMKYYLGDKFIAVGVVDIVQDGLSSVYFFYEPSYKEHRMGVFSSLIEIQYIRWLQLSFPQFKNYYMGFYIADCEKMKYKVDYGPCQLLCPVTYNFVSLNQRVQQKVELILKGQKDLKLAQQSTNLIQDMDLGRSIGPYIDKNTKIVYGNQRLQLKQINPHYAIHILKRIQANLPVWGKNLFQIFTLTL